MLRGPKGEKRPADMLGCAVLVARIATGEVEEVIQSPSRTAVSSAGGLARAKKLSETERKKIAEKAAKERWK
jgi:hypothetical protein